MSSEAEQSHGVSNNQDSGCLREDQMFDMLIRVSLDDLSTRCQVFAQWRRLTYELTFLPVHCRRRADVVISGYFVLGMYYSTELSSVRARISRSAVRQSSVVVVASDGREQPRLPLPDSGAPKPRPRLEQLLWHATVPLLDRPSPLEKAGCRGHAAGWVQRCFAGMPQEVVQTLRRTSRWEPNAHSSDRDSRRSNRPMDDEATGAPSMPKNTFRFWST